MKRLMVSLGLVWFALFGGSETSVADDEADSLFAADEIKPSGMTYFLIDRLFRGRMKPVPAGHQRTFENEVGIEAALNQQAIELYRPKPGRKRRKPSAET